MTISPSNPPSSSPTAWSIVDLPEPDGPSSATISPAFTVRSTPRSTWMVCPPWVKLRFRLRIWSTSLIAQHLYGIGTRRLPRRIERGEEGKHHGHDDDRDDFDRIGLGRKLRRSAERRVGKERVSTCSSRWSPYQKKQKKKKNT